MAGPLITPGPAQTKGTALGSAGSSLAAIMTANVVTGNTLVLLTGLSASGAYINRILDSQNNVYSFQSSAFLYSGTGGTYVPNGKVFVHLAPNIIGGFTTISIYLSGGTAVISSLVREVSGVTKAPTANQAGSAYSAVIHPYKSPFIVPPQPNVLAIGWISQRGNTTVVVSGYDNAQTQASLSGASVSIANVRVTTPVASSSYWNAAGTQNFQTGILYLRGLFDDEALNLGNLGCG